LIAAEAEAEMQQPEFVATTPPRAGTNPARPPSDRGGIPSRGESAAGRTARAAHPP
jgi:hypothetical protein